MNTTYMLTAIILVSVIILLAGVGFKAGFQAISTSNEDIEQQLKKQMNYIEYMKQHKALSQLIKYIPQLEILNRYKNKSQELILPLQSQIDESTKKKIGEWDESGVKIKPGVLDDLSKQIKQLEKHATMDLSSRYSAKPITGLKSHVNGLELSLDKENGLVKVNDGCLRVTSNNSYDVVPCNVDDQDQKFSLEFVYNNASYKNKLAPGYPKLDNLGQVKYPFVFVKANTNDNCVKNTHSGISVEPCREYTGQRWAPIE